MAASSLSVFETIADRLDPDALETVVAANAELELLIGKFSMPCACGASASASVASPKPSMRSRSVKMASWRMRISAACPIASRGASAVGRDVELQLVVVGALADAGGLDLVRHAPHGREDRVDRDDADVCSGPR